MRRNRRSIPLTLLLLSVMLTWLPGRPGETPAQDKSLKAEPHVSKPNREIAVTLTASEQRNGGITVAPLKSMMHRKEIRVYGKVPSIHGLADLRARYIQAESQMENARTRLETSRKEYERLKFLNAQNRNVSDKALQAAEAAWRIDGVHAQASAEALPILVSMMRLEWGDVIANWLTEGSTPFQRLMQRQDVLVQLTLQPGSQVSTMPESVGVLSAYGLPIWARRVSAAPGTDPHIQGASFFYLAPSEKENLPFGMNVVATVPTGIQEKGVLIPLSSVIWWQGSPWAYLQRGAERFFRREVPTQNPVQDGYYVSQGFGEGERVVIRGAQLLLSQEFRSKIQGGGD